MGIVPAQGQPNQGRHVRGRWYGTVLGSDSSAKRYATWGNTRLFEHLYHPSMDLPVKHWWNGQWGRTARRDLYLYKEGDRYVVEALSGGKDGTSRWSAPMTEIEALALVTRWQQGQDGWREMSTPRIGRTE